MTVGHRVTCESTLTLKLGVVGSSKPLLWGPWRNLLEAFVILKPQGICLSLILERPEGVFNGMPEL